MFELKNKKFPHETSLMCAFRGRGHLVNSCDALTGEMLIFQAINNRKGPNFSSWAADVMENV